MRDTDTRKFTQKEKVEAMVDRLGAIAEQLTQLKEEDEKLRAYFKEKYPAGTVVYGTQFEVLLGESTRREVEPEKAYKRLGLQKFLGVVRVNMTELKRVLSAEDIDSMATTETVSTVRVSKKK